MVGQGEMGFWAIVLIGLYLFLNISLNMLNKYVLYHYGFKFPILLSITHMLFSFFALGPFMCLKQYRGLHATTLSKQWQGLLAVGGFFAVNIGFTNVSLLTIPLSLNQVIRASIPLVAAVGSVFIEGFIPTKMEVLSLTMLAGGVAVASWEGSDTEASSYGVILCILGTISNGLMMSCIGRLMSEKLDVLRLTFYTAPVTISVLVPFYFYMEHNRFMHYHRAEAASPVYLGLILVGCCNALAYNLVHASVIKVTSAVTTTVLGELKIVLILVLSATILGESQMWTVKMVLGCAAALIGFFVYSHCRLQASPSAHSKAADAAAHIRKQDEEATRPLLDDEQSSTPRAGKRTGHASHS